MGLYFRGTYKCVDKEILEASYGETFHCMGETANCSGNSFDLFAVAVIRDDEIISYVLKLISVASPQFQRQAQVW